MKIVEHIRSSLHRKVLVAFLAVGIVPYFFIVLYFTYWGREAIVEREVQTHTLQAQQAKVLMQNRLKQLEQEIVFLAGLELFDDMISGDIDRRISRLLEQKRAGLQGEAISLFAVDTHGVVVAASHYKELDKHFTLDTIVSDASLQQGAVVVGENLFLFTAVKASFDQRQLGYLVARYPLKNLTAYIVQTEGIRYRISSAHAVLIAGPQDDPSRFSAVDNAMQMVVSTPLEGVLYGYDLLYIIDKEAMFVFINRFMLYLMLLFMVGVALIVWMGRGVTRHIVAPIQALTGAAEAIIKTQKYDLRVHSDAIDETATLAKMFNRLVATTGESLEKLAQENQLRMQRFIDLTDMFNHITQVSDEKACMQVSIEKLSMIVPHKMSFVPAYQPLPEGSVGVEMQQRDVNSGEQMPYGTLVVNKAHFDDESEARFFTSVAAMIALQIERIGLIGKIQSASAAKTAFISNMSHELRTPLNAIIGFSQYLMAYEALSDEQIDTVAKIEKAAVHLLGVINDILDIAKIEAGKMEVHRVETDLGSLLRECMELIEPLAEDKGLALKGVEGPSSAIILHTDVKLLKQVVINLLSNAVKFTESGSIDVAVEMKPDSVEIRVCDTGVGINPEVLMQVFDEFTQLKNTQQLKHKGTGLGLSLSRHIVQTLGGELRLESEGEEQGTKAVITLMLRE